ncbi:ABC transporter ATP-binding protein [Thiolapillus sp.]
MLTIKGLRKAYGDLLAVDSLDLSLREGEIFGFLGPNGAGKTTTIAMIAGLMEQDAGEIRLGNAGAPTDPQTRLQLGYVPQELALYGPLTARENLQFFAKMLGLKNRTLKQAVDEALQLAELTDRANDRVDTFSGGMKRRLNLAVAMLHRPRLLLLDEPTVGVDPQSRNALLQGILALRERGHTIIYTTHYMEEAQKICDRIGIMDHGRLLSVGTVKELIHAHGGEYEILLQNEEGDHCIRDINPLHALQSLDFHPENDLLSIKPPDLEQVFLNLTGRTLRD